MESQQINDFLKQIITQYSYISSIMITDTEGTEICNTYTKKGEFDEDTAFLEELRLVSNTIFATAIEQICKLETGAVECITSYFQKYAVFQRMLGKKTVLTVIGRKECDQSVLGLIADELHKNFEMIDKTIFMLNSEN